MITQTITIGLVVERRALTGDWGGHAWRPVTVFAQAPDVAPWTPLGGGPAAMRYYAGEALVHLFSTDTANYRDNVGAEHPKLWVVLRPHGEEPGAAPPVEVHLVTADPAEGEAATEAGTDVVETIDMPAAVAAEIAAFIAAHHVERPFHKRKRDQAATDAGWRGGAGARGAAAPDDGAKE